MPRMNKLSSYRTTWETGMTDLALVKLWAFIMIALVADFCIILGAIPR